MKCINCGHEMPDNAKFCKMCGTPTDAEQTVLADSDPAPSADRPRTDASTRDYDLSMFEDNGKESRPRNQHRDSVSDDNSLNADRHADSEPRYDDDYDDYRSGREPREKNRQGGGSRYSDSKKDKKKKSCKKPLIISIVALVLVIAIITSVILVITRNTVSAKELEEAKENYLPPAQAVVIDTSLSDPSNDKIKFKYDDRARIVSCTYSVNNKTYDQSYSYDDGQRSVNIKTNYRKHPIFTKDIGYDKVTTANTFESVEGYYLRLDDQCIGKSEASSSAVSTPQATAAPDTDEPTDEPTEEPTEEPADYREQYISFLDQTDLNYDYGTLIYLNDDDTPELLLFQSEETNYWPGCKDTDCKEAYLCWINNGEVHSDTVYCDASMKTGNWDGDHHTDTNYYVPRAGYLRAEMVYGAHGQDWVMYDFDGSSLNRIHNVKLRPAKDTNDGNPGYNVDNEDLSEDDYGSNYGQIGWEKITKSTSKNDLPDYIRNFE